MANLPLFTAIVIVVVPLLWVLYTIIFLIVSRNYKEADVDR